MVELKEGIIFEDNGYLMQWGKPIDLLAKEFKAERRDEGDRTKYYWGTHTILNGLELELSNSYWNFGKEKRHRIFNSIEFWAVGDTPAKENLERISKHLTNQLGEPQKKNITKEPEISMEWVIRRVTIRLSFFEQHAYKLVLTIKKKQPFLSSLFSYERP